MRVHIKPIAAILFAVIAQSVCAATENASTAPFDFSYRIVGATELRPVLVFNDAKDTYVEIHDDSVRVTAAGVKALRQGPYYVFRGIQDLITLSAKGKTTTIYYEPAVQPAPMPDPVDVKSRALPDQQVVPPMMGSGDVKPALMPVHPAVVESNTPPATSAGSASTDIAPLDIRHSDSIRQPTNQSCVGSPVKNETTLLVEFSDGKASLSAEAQSKLKGQAGKQLNAVDRVFIRMPSAAEGTELGKRRALSIANAVVNAGVPRSIVHANYSSGYAGMTEVVYLTSTRLPCGDNKIVVKGNASAITVLARDADAKAVLEKIADATNRKFMVEGNPKNTVVNVALTSVTLTNALAKIGREIDATADVVLRDNELVLRYN